MYSFHSSYSVEVYNSMCYVACIIAHWPPTMVYILQSRRTMQSPYASTRHGMADSVYVYNACQSAIPFITN